MNIHNTIAEMIGLDNDNDSNGMATAAASEVDGGGWCFD